MENIGVPLRKLDRQYKIDKKYVSNTLRNQNVSLIRKLAPKYLKKQFN